MNNPLFSVIIPAYNVEDYLPACIDSVLSQTISDFELILVDDGSTDQTGVICDQYAKKTPHPSIISQNTEKVNRNFPESSQNSTISPKAQPKTQTQPKAEKKSIKNPIIVIHQPNSGLSAARNSGVNVASGEYLIFLDGDDFLEHDALAAIQQNLEPGLDLLRYQAQEIRINGKKVPHTEIGFSTMPGIAAFDRLARYYYVENAWLYAYRRDFFLENHFAYAPGRLAEDFGLTPLIIACAQAVKSIPDICYNYRERLGSIMHDPAKITRRSADIFSQFKRTLPKIAALPQTDRILHYLVVSFLTGATSLSQKEFLDFYAQAKQAGLLRYIHPSKLKSLPRAFLLKHFPRLFYRVYHR